MHVHSHLQRYAYLHVHMHTNCNTHLYIHTAIDRLTVDFIFLTFLSHKTLTLSLISYSFFFSYSRFISTLTATIITLKADDRSVPSYMVPRGELKLSTTRHGPHKPEYIWLRNTSIPLGRYVLMSISFFFFSFFELGSDTGKGETYWKKFNKPSQSFWYFSLSVFPVTFPMLFFSLSYTFYFFFRNIISHAFKRRQHDFIRRKTHTNLWKYVSMYACTAACIHIYVPIYIAYISCFWILYSNMRVKLCACVCIYIYLVAYVYAIKFFLLRTLSFSIIKLLHVRVCKYI